MNSAAESKKQEGRKIKFDRRRNEAYLSCPDEAVGEIRKGRRVGRRKFLFMCGKLALGAIAVCVMPLEIGFSKDKPAGKKRFNIKVKPFSDSLLYQQHNLSG